MYKNWMQAMEIEPALAEKIKTECPEGTCTLSYAFEMNLLDFEDYKSWALKNLNMAYLNSDFFSSTDLIEEVKDFCSEQKVTSAGSHDYLNFYKYENIHYVACLWPPLGQADAQPPAGSDKRFIFVLTSPETLESLKLMSRKESSTSHLQAVKDQPEESHSHPPKVWGRRSTDKANDQDSAAHRKKAS